MSKKRRIHLMQILFFVCCLQDITIISLGDNGIKLYHIAALLLIPYLLIRGRIVLPDRKVLIFGALVLISSIVGMPKYGINSFILNYIFAFIFLILIYNIGKDFKEDEWIRLLKKCAIVLMFVIWIKNVYYYRAFIQFFRNPYGHPMVMTFFGGGVNLEATYMGMLTPLFFRDRKATNKIIYSTIATALSVIYVSRTALIINMICWLWIGYSEIKSKRWLNVFSLMMIAMIAFIAVLAKGLGSYLFERITSLTNLSTDVGAVGRLSMWKYVWTVFSSNLLGVGIGNSIVAINKISPVYFWEDNIHNIYMQMYVDLGIFGGTYYLFIIICFAKKIWKKIYRNPIESILMLYILSCLFQFRGAEVFIYFFLAIYLRTQRNTRIIKGVPVL